MPVDLVELVGGGRAAVLTMEIQRGVVGDRSSFPELAAAVAEGKVIANAARLVSAARHAGVPVVHCTAGFRADRAGSAATAPLISAMLKRPAHLLEGTDAVELVPELGPEPGDLVSHRRHGVGRHHHAVPGVHRLHGQADDAEVQRHTRRHHRARPQRP